MSVRASCASIRNALARSRFLAPFFLQLKSNKLSIGLSGVNMYDQSWRM